MTFNKGTHATKADFEAMIKTLKPMELAALVYAITESPDIQRMEKKINLISFKNKVLQEIKDLHDTAEQLTKLLSGI